MSYESDDIRVVVSIDFGTTFSGYAYAHKSSPDLITVEDIWEGPVSRKTPTIIKYQGQSNTVQDWGQRASPTKWNADQSVPIQLFKLFLLNDPTMKLPVLPDKRDYRRVIRDYLAKLNEMIKEKVGMHWEVDFYSQVLIVLTVPVEFDDDAIATMRYCAYKAGFMKEIDSRFLIFITEPQAAAVYCLNSSKEVRNLKPGESFMVVDGGGGTVDLISHELLTNNKLSEITEPTGGICGSSFIDKEFTKFLRRKLGESTFELLEKENYNSLQKIIQEFIRRVKIPFTGHKSDFKSHEICLEEYRLKEPRSTLKDIIKEGKEKQQLAADKWSIYVEFDDVKRMFDPFILKIIQLIEGQLTRLQQQNKKCSAMMLVGGFGESKYLQAIIKEKFSKIVPNIAVPNLPVTAVLKGGVQFGLNVETVVNRVLKRTYGTNVLRRSLLGDPPTEMLPNGFTVVFKALAKRGSQFSVDKKVVRLIKPPSLTSSIVNVDIYVTKEYDAKFCNDPEVSLLRHLEIEIPKDDNDDYDDKIISLNLTFGSVEILATAKNQKTGEKYRVNKKTRERLEYE